MNLLMATLTSTNGSSQIEVGGYTLPVPAEVTSARPALAGYAGKKIILGIRPEDMEDAALAREARSDSTITATVELREALGSDVVIHFKINAAQPTTDDVKELASDVGAEALEVVEASAEQGESNVVARLNPRTRAAKGERLDLVVDTRRMHFFDPDDGSGIWDGK
jgi:multiple sugar transport system ATP-binding protein